MIFKQQLRLACLLVSRNVRECRSSFILSNLKTKIGSSSKNMRKEAISHPQLPLWPCNETRVHYGRHLANFQVWLRGETDCNEDYFCFALFGSRDLRSYCQLSDRLKPCLLATVYAFLRESHEILTTSSLRPSEKTCCRFSGNEELEIAGRTMLRNPV